MASIGGESCNHRKNPYTNLLKRPTGKHQTRNFQPPARGRLVFGSNNLNFSRENLLTPEELAQNLHLSPATLAAWRSERRGPPFVKVGRRIWYPKETFDGWML